MDIAKSNVQRLPVRHLGARFRQPVDGYLFGDDSQSPAGRPGAGPLRGPAWIVLANHCSGMMITRTTGKEIDIQPVESGIHTVLLQPGVLQFVGFPFRLLKTIPFTIQ